MADPSTTPALTLISSMITPSLLILSSASLVATALTRLSRVIDRSRRFLEMSEEQGASNGHTDECIETWMARYEQRSMLSERTVSTFFGAIGLLTAGCLGIAVDRQFHGTLFWVPEGLVISGLALILYGCALMVREGRLAMIQVREEFDVHPKRRRKNLDE